MFNFRRVQALYLCVCDQDVPGLIHPPPPRYFELRPMYDRSQEKIRELEREAAKLKDELTEAELRHQKMYLQMFLKGQQAAKLQADDDQVRS